MANNYLGHEKNVQSTVTYGGMLYLTGELFNSFRLRHKGHEAYRFASSATLSLASRSRDMNKKVVCSQHEQLVLPKKISSHHAIILHNVQIILLELYFRASRQRILAKQPFLSAASTPLIHV